MFKFLRRIYWKIRLKRRGIDVDDLRRLVVATKFLEDLPRSEVSWKI